MKRRELEALLTAILPPIKKFVADELRQRDEKIDALEKSLKATIKHRGTYDPSHEYSPGDCVTHDGSLWKCVQATAARPGDSQSAGWLLIVKRGRDGRDARR